MKVSELIELLGTLPPGAMVVLCDTNRMAHEATGEPSGEGLYYDFDVDYDEEMFFAYEDEEQENPIPTVVISFDTDYAEKAKEMAELEADLKAYEDNN